MGDDDDRVIRKEIANCIEAGKEKRYDDVIQSANVVLSLSSLAATTTTTTTTTTPSSFVQRRRRRRQYVIALSYKGISLFQIKMFSEAMVTLDEAYHLIVQLQQHQLPSSSSCSSTNNNNNNGPCCRYQLLLPRVISCLVQTCHILGREVPLPPLVKFPRTSHLFRPAHSMAVTDDDLVLPKRMTGRPLFQLLTSGNDDDDDDDTDNVHVGNISLEEKIDGANLGLSLSLDGRNVLVQNRSHYLSQGGEHAQFSQLATWIEVHAHEVKRILEIRPNSNEAPLQQQQQQQQQRWRRRVLYGEWVAARHSIPYQRLPGYFVAFDIMDGDQFVSRRRFHGMMVGSGIPVAPTIHVPNIDNMVGMSQTAVEDVLLNLLDTTPSQFRSDGGPIEGIVIRIDDGDWTQHRSKVVRPDFVGGISGRWSNHQIQKQQIDVTFSSQYLNTCYHLSGEMNKGQLPRVILSPRHRAVVTYTEQGSEGGFVATATLLPREACVRSSSSGCRMVVLPRNLCWLWPGEVLVAAQPKSADQIQAMHDALNIQLVITLNQEESLPTEYFSNECDCENYFRPIPNRMAPTLQEMDGIGDDIVRAISEGKAVLEHCAGGKGRAGTVAACLLLRFGREGIRARIEAENVTSSSKCSGGRFLRPRPPFFTGEGAVAEIRQRRPGSVETVVQEYFVKEYAQHLWRLAAKFEETNSESLGYLETSSQKNVHKKGTTYPRKRRIPKYVVLAGLPGSGKTTFARRLCPEDEGLDKKAQTVHASTDELGRKECTAYVGRIAAGVCQGSVGGIVVDSCNISTSKRREWYNIMHQPPRESTALVFFDMPMDVCISRVSCRVDHPTIPFGRGHKAVKSHADNMGLPTTPRDEQMFGQIVILRSKEDIDVLFAKWGVLSQLPDV